MKQKQLERHAFNVKQICWVKNWESNSAACMRAKPWALFSPHLAAHLIPITLNREHERTHLTTSLRLSRSFYLFTWASSSLMNSAHRLAWWFTLWYSYYYAWVFRGSSQKPISWLLRESFTSVRENRLVSLARPLSRCLSQLLCGLSIDCWCHRGEILPDYIHL